MRRIYRGTLVPFDPEIEQTYRRRRATQRSLSTPPTRVINIEDPQERMGDQPPPPPPQPRALKEMGTPGAYRAACGIAPPTTEANNFEIRASMISLIERRQFSGAKNESPHAHLNEFEKYCNTIKVNGVTQDFIRMKMFPFSLIGKALFWIDKEVKPNTLRTWDDVTRAFLKRFYSQKKTAEVRALIQGFRQKGGETLYEAWERFKDLQRECPHHDIPTYQLLQIFYGGLSPQGKTSLDAGAGGPIMNKTEDEVIDIIEDVVQNYQEWQEGERESTGKSGGSVYSVDHLNAINNLTSQVASLGKELSAMKTKLDAPSTSQVSQPSQIKGRGNFSNPSTSNNMPNGCLFCDNCGSYDHDTSMCSYDPQSHGDEGNECENESVNALTYDNRPRYDTQRYQPPNQRGNGENYYNQRGNDYDGRNQNQGGYRNQRDQNPQGNYNQQGGYGNQSNYNQGNYRNQGQGGGNQWRGNWNNNQQRGNPQNFQTQNQQRGQPGFLLGVLHPKTTIKANLHLKNPPLMRHWKS